MTIQIQRKDPRTGAYSPHCMPVIRHPNFSDRTGDVPLDKFYLYTWATKISFPVGGPSFGTAIPNGEIGPIPVSPRRPDGGWKIEDEKMV